MRMHESPGDRMACMAGTYTADSTFSIGNLAKLPDVPMKVPFSSAIHVCSKAAGGLRVWLDGAVSWIGSKHGQCTRTVHAQP